MLVVDDNVDLVAMLAAGLRSSGSWSRRPIPGPDWCWRSGAGPTSCSSISPSGLDGYEVARQLRAAARARDAAIRLIALTGYGREADIARAGEAGFDAHLVKPVNFAQLEQLLRAATP